MFTIHAIRFRCQKCDAEKEVKIPNDLFFTEVLDLLAKEQEEFCPSCEQIASDEEAADYLLAQQELEDFEGLTIYDEIAAAEAEAWE